MTPQAASSSDGAKALLEAATNLDEETKRATHDIDTTGKLSLTDAMKLSDSGDQLMAATKIALFDLISQKPTLDTLGVSPQVLSALQTQKADSAALADTIVDKVPTFGQGIAKNSMKKMDEKMDEAIAAFT